MASVCLLIFADDVDQDAAFEKLETLGAQAHFVGTAADIRQDGDVPLVEDIVIATKEILVTLIEEHAASPHDAQYAEKALYHATI